MARVAAIEVWKYTYKGRDNSFVVCMVSRWWMELMRLISKLAAHTRMKGNNGFSRWVDTSLTWPFYCDFIQKYNPTPALKKKKKVNQHKHFFLPFFSVLTLWLRLYSSSPGNSQWEHCSLQQQQKKKQLSKRKQEQDRLSSQCYFISIPMLKYSTYTRQYRIVSTVMTTDDNSHDFQIFTSSRHLFVS